MGARSDALRQPGFPPHFTWAPIAVVTPQLSGWGQRPRSKGNHHGYGCHHPRRHRVGFRQQQFNDLHDYQAAVGGLIEAIDLDHPPMSFFANEEAKLIGLPINQRATALWWLHVPAVYGIDFLAGDVVLIGRPDEEGDTQSAPDEFVRLLLEPTTYRVQVQTADSSNAWSGNGRRFDSYFAAAK